MLHKKEDEIVMSHMKRLVTDDKEELIWLTGLEQTRRQLFKTTAVRKNQHPMLTEDENAVVEELDLIARSNQDDDGQLLKSVKGEEYVEFRSQCTTDRKQVHMRWLSYLLAEFEEEKGIADPGVRMPEAVKKRREDTSLQNLILFTSILDNNVTDQIGNRTVTYFFLVA